MVGFLAVMGVFFHLSWIILAAVMLFFEFKSKMRLSHPPVYDEDAPLGPKRTVLSLVVLLIFVLSFIPDPIKGASLLDILKRLVGSGRMTRTHRSSARNLCTTFVEKLWKRTASVEPISVPAST